MGENPQKPVFTIFGVFDHEFFYSRHYLSTWLNFPTLAGKWFEEPSPPDYIGSRTIAVNAIKSLEEMESFTKVDVSLVFDLRREWENLVSIMGRCTVSSSNDEKQKMLHDYEVAVFFSGILNNGYIVRI